jgi:hypothetical protein
VGRDVSDAAGADDQDVFFPHQTSPFVMKGYGENGGNRIA